MTTDRELLELAAKAVGLDSYNGETGMYCSDWSTDQWTEWNALTDDGDAFRLAVKLGIGFQFELDSVVAIYNYPWRAAEPLEEDQGQAARRVIVRAAAEIGRAL